MAVTLPDPAAYRASTIELPAGAAIDEFALAAGTDGPATELDTLLGDAAAGGACFVSADVHLAGRGRAALLELAGGMVGAASQDVQPWLAAVAASDPVHRPGSGPVAMGALPFARHRPATMIVPAVTVGSDGQGRCWMTVVTGPGRSEPDLTRFRAAVLALAGRRGPGPVVARPRAGAGELTDDLVPHPSEEDFVASVEAALAAIEAGEVVKVVLQRQVEANLERPVDVAGVLHRLHGLEPACTVFAVVGDGVSSGGVGDAFVGASPELLVRRRASSVMSHPLAGTVARSADPDKDERAVTALWSSPKERAEHQVVADAVAGLLRPWCTRLDLASEPEILRLNEMAHLATPMRGVLRDAGAGADALTLAAALHPTPAVAGTPTDAAVALLTRLEPVPRGLYAGPVGWLDARGDGDFVIAIRSASVTGRRATVYAGMGVVAASDPKEELAETTLKLRTALAALRS